MAAPQRLRETSAGGLELPLQSNLGDLGLIGVVTRLT
jgi:hypothetical protein